MLGGRAMVAMCRLFGWFVVLAGGGRVLFSVWLARGVGLAGVWCMMTVGGLHFSADRKASRGWHSRSLAAF